MNTSSTLKDHFPMLRDRSELMQEIGNDYKLSAVFQQWKKEQQEEFLNFCTGMRGVKILYDSFFKEVMNPEYDPARLESFLFVILKRKVRILKVLPNDSTRIANETSLLITDIVVELEDGSIANIEIQKIGYFFPGARSACYSSDMLLRRYKKIRSSQGTDFSYKDIKNVFLIVIFESSPAEFHAFPDTYYHHSRQVFDSGLKLDMLQEYILIPLDIFHRCMHNKAIDTPLEAWLTFLSDDSPERIVELITRYPEFKPMYDTLYDMCLNTERVMEMFSKELQQLDQNTVRYMIEEQQKMLAQKEAQLSQINEEISRKDEQLSQKEQQLSQKNQQLSQKDALIQELQRKLDALSAK